MTTKSLKEEFHIQARHACQTMRVVGAICGGWLAAAVSGAGASICGVPMPVAYGVAVANGVGAGVLTYKYLPRLTRAFLGHVQK
jgi:hypothetical protein